MTSQLLAHLGHGTSGFGAGALHPLVGPDHLLAMLAVGIVAALASDRRVALLTPAAFLIGMITGGAMGILGMQLPAAETSIALSVICLGAICLTGMDRVMVALPVAALLFGIVHGHAHGSELPSAAAPGAYVVGFILTTAALHAIGARIGLLLRRTPQVRLLAGTAISSTGLALLLSV
jgi:urease accessory protein